MKDALAGNTAPLHMHSASSSSGNWFWYQWEKVSRLKLWRKTVSSFLLANQEIEWTIPNELNYLFLVPQNHACGKTTWNPYLSFLLWLSALPDQLTNAAVTGIRAALACCLCWHRSSDLHCRLSQTSEGYSAAETQACTEKFYYCD